MTKRLVDIDDDLLDAAKAAAGERTIKATVHRALELLVDQNRRREAGLRQRWADLGDSMADLQDDAVMDRAWR